MIYCAIPLLDEFDYIVKTINAIRNQKYKNFTVYFCVNQPNDWWGMDDKKAICIDNQKTIEYLNTIKDFEIKIIDKSSKGYGWIGKFLGVGAARRTLMDEISKCADNEDIILSLDGDTLFNENYFGSIVNNFARNKKMIAISIPYYHLLTGQDDIDRAILRYEIYMRYYLLNLQRIKSFYAFTALGSAIALKVKNYKKVGGITPKVSGEDFYFLQKLRKSGDIAVWNSEKVYPSARLSSRVAFGTGPALIKGIEGDFDSYPIYNYHYFDIIKETIDKFPALFKKNIKTPLDDFFRKIFKNGVFEKLRENYKTEEQFVKSCNVKFDALRILQFLKYKQESNENNERNLIDFLNEFYSKDELLKLNIEFKIFSFLRSSINDLDNLRNFLVSKEDEYFC